MDPGDIIRDAILGILVGTDIDADNAAGTRRLARQQLLAQRRMAEIGKAEAVDDAAIGGQPEETRLRVACLGLRRHRADLGKAEAEPENRIDRLAILIEPGRHADRRRKRETEKVALQAGIDLDRRGRKNGEFSMRIVRRCAFSASIWKKRTVRGGKNPSRDRLIELMAIGTERQGHDVGNRPHQKVA